MSQTLVLILYGLFIEFERWKLKSKEMPVIEAEEHALQMNAYLD